MNQKWLLVNLFLANIPTSYPLKAPESFRGYEKETTFRNGLKYYRFRRKCVINWNDNIFQYMAFFEIFSQH